MAIRQPQLGTMAVIVGALFVPISLMLTGCGGGTRSTTSTTTSSSNLSTAALRCSSDSTKGAFCVAEVKPHYQCEHGDAAERSKTYVNNLVGQSIGLIALIQFQTAYDLPAGYTAFGGACADNPAGAHADPVVVLVDEGQFSIEDAIGTTIVNNYAAMPYIVNGSAPMSGLANCVANPTNKSVGTRAYAGAVLKHKSTGKQFCTISGTFPHCDGSWYPEFVTSIREKCSGKELLLIVDSNAACNGEPKTTRDVSMQDISNIHQAGWGHCSDPAVASVVSPTCCHDTAPGKWYSPTAQYWYDRTALCSNGAAPGVVEQYQVKDQWVCGTNEEHHFTSAVVQLGS